MKPRRPSPFAPQLRVHRRFHSPSLRNSRDVVVWLPPGYEASGPTARRRYPVVYFQDGQNIFDPATAFLGRDWGAGETALRLIRSRAIVAPILVGVANTGEHRIDEYSPTRGEFNDLDGIARRSAGDGKRYARFFVRELKPFIDARYRTLPGPRTTGLIGSSMGGLISLYFALWHPRVFGRVAAMSPSIWWDNRVLLRDLAALTRKPDVALWIDAGTAEPGWETVQLLRDVLVGRGWNQGGDLHYDEVAGAGHNEAAWAARLGGVLTWMLGRD
ncbi:MAG TPA: alpha/beta hydrolase-fold protein [Candidatus Didemnitutus sp.]|nr:alpha/beta hydrolase-fold protein [Candidatus Didemnitutus sp.]